MNAGSRVPSGAGLMPEGLQVPPRLETVLVDAAVVLHVDLRVKDLSGVFEHGWAHPLMYPGAEYLDTGALQSVHEGHLGVVGQTMMEVPVVGSLHV